MFTRCVVSLPITISVHGGRGGGGDQLPHSPPTRGGKYLSYERGQHGKP